MAIKWSLAQILFLSIIGTIWEYSRFWNRSMKTTIFFAFSQTRTSSHRKGFAKRFVRHFFLSYFASLRFPAIWSEKNCLIQINYFKIQGLLSLHPSIAKLFTHGIPRINYQKTLTRLNSILIRVMAELLDLRKASLPIHQPFFLLNLDQLGRCRMVRLL